MKLKKTLTILLALCTMAPFYNVPISAASDGIALKSKMSSSTVAYAISDPIINKNSTITMQLLTSEGKKELTTMTLSTQQLANLTDKGDGKIIYPGLKKDSFVEICRDKSGRVIVFNKLFNLTMDQFFITKKYGPELSPVNGNPGNLIASGWIEGKTEKTITVGDANKFKETYTLSDHVKIFEINTKNQTITPSSLFALPVTQQIDGVYWKTQNRQQVVVVFDDNYKNADKAKVSELYYLTPQTTIPDEYLVEPDDMPIGSFLANSKSKAKPNNYPSYTSTEPFAIVPGKMYYVGDNEVTVYLFNTRKGLIMLDAGWPNSGYQYWNNIEKVGFNPREIKYILLTHGHGDHYGTAVELDRMIKNAGGDPVIYETYEDIKGYDKYGYRQISGVLKEKEILSIIDKYYINDKWMNFGDVRIFPTLTPGHTVGTGSFKFEVKQKNSQKITFGYIGGYGVNGLSAMPMEQDFQRLAFQYGLQWLQQNFTNIDYVSPQHTNQYPFLEAHKAAELKGISFLEALAKGNDNWINYCEKRYQVITNETLYQNRDLSRYPNAGGYNYETIEAKGPYRRAAGSYQLTLTDDGKNIHGFDMYQNKNDALDGVISTNGSNVANGMVIEKDSYIHDPDGWYVQISAKVGDAYNGAIMSGPIELLREDWSEILRTERMNSKEEAERLLTRIKKGKTYTVKINEKNEIVLADNLLDTFHD